MPNTAPQPEVVLGHHPDHGVVAALPTQSAAAAWMLERLEFRRIADHPHLYALTEQHRDVPDRLRWAIKVLDGAGYAVHSDLSLNAGPEPSAELPLQVAAPAPVPEREPDVVFAESPSLGVIGTVGDGPAQEAHAVLKSCGWWRHAEVDFYFPPFPHTDPHLGERDNALQAVAATARELRRAGYQVGVQSRISAEVASYRPPAATTATAREFPTAEAALLRSPVVRQVPTAKAAPPGPPPTAVDPRAAFARAR
ncbi:hypothetical protein [Streptomyces sp. TLI_171]|uniref:hypothetical protein n=1 Tax=Streptomyces sp. TLI_171 TaxID=1938859 RepID=UPI000C1A2B9A|nr:hypothetical protein [Streptomyces sp. TLI_171]RKE22016.1 hypothetical protein BX266_5426 [Streptomyces sp. TLI_171]